MTVSSVPPLLSSTTTTTHAVSPGVVTALTVFAATVYGTMCSTPVNCEAWTLDP